MCVMIAVRLQWMTTARGLKTHKCSETFKLVLLCIWYRLHKNVRKETSSVNLLEVGHSHKWGRATGTVVVIDRKVTLHKHSSQFQAMGTFPFKSGHVAQVTNYQTVNWTMHGVLQDLLESCSAVLYLDTPLFTSNRSTMWAVTSWTCLWNVVWHLWGILDIHCDIYESLTYVWLFNHGYMWICFWTYPCFCKGQIAVVVK